MRRPLILFTAVTSALAMPVAAQAPGPTTTAFDGTYFGVSRTFEEEAVNGGKTWTRYCPQYDQEY
jgi:hypothetical protein